MPDLPVLLATAGFAVRGIGAIAKRTVATAPAPILELTPAGRNEVRALDGGFGL